MIDKKDKNSLEFNNSINAIEYIKSLEDKIKYKNKNLLILSDNENLIKLFKKRNESKFEKNLYKIIIKHKISFKDYIKLNVKIYQKNK